MSERVMSSLSYLPFFRVRFFFADRVVNELVACLRNFGIPLYTFLSISADGPNVYKSIRILSHI